MFSSLFGNRRKEMTEGDEKEPKQQNQSSDESPATANDDGQAEPDAPRKGLTAPLNQFARYPGDPGRFEGDPEERGRMAGLLENSEVLERIHVQAVSWEDRLEEVEGPAIPRSLVDQLYDDYIAIKVELRALKFQKIRDKIVADRKPAPAEDDRVSRKTHQEVLDRLQNTQAELDALRQQHATRSQLQAEHKEETDVSNSKSGESYNAHRTMLLLRQIQAETLQCSVETILYGCRKNLEGSSPDIGHAENKLERAYELIREIESVIEGEEAGQEKIRLPILKGRASFWYARTLLHLPGMTDEARARFIEARDLLDGSGVREEGLVHIWMETVEKLQ